MHILVRTPSPYPTESLFGFVLRVSECNGYETPRHMFPEHGFTRGQIAAAGFPVKAFTEMLGQDPNLFTLMAYCNGDVGERTYKILDHEFGQSLRKGYLRLSQAAFCPQCAEESEFVETFWDLSAAIACPKHQTWALKRCHACDQPVKWFRRRLLSCDCGAPFSEAPLQTADTATIELMALLKAKLYRCPVSSLDNTSKFPLQLLDAMPFTALLEAVVHFGNFDSETEHESGATISPYGNVASVLAQWPTGYHNFLRKIGDRFLARGETAVGLRKQFRPFYQAMFVHSASAEDFTFLKEEFLNFGLHHWGKASVDERLFRSMKQGQRLYSKSAVASKHGISAPTMKRLIADGSLASKSIKVGTRTRTVIDLEKSTLPIDADEHISVREAAKFLGLPVAVIKHLRVSGVYAKRPRLGHGSSWYQDDLQDFLARGLSLVAKFRHAPDGVRLGQAMRLKFRDAGAKSAVVAAVLQGQIKLLGRVRDNLGGIILDKTELEVFVRSLRTETVRDTYLPKDVAKITGLCPTAIDGAITLGLLSAERSRGRRRIPATAVERFKAQFVAICQIAATFGTLSRRLLQMCRYAGIEVVNVPRRKGPAQPLLRRADQAQLERLWLEMNSKPANREEREAASETVLRNYLGRLQAYGEELPRRGRKPNKVAIARACGFSRHVLYNYKRATALLDQFK
jgi:hypothetical protein